MPHRKVFTYVSPKTNQEVANSLCAQLPVVLNPVSSVEELFPLLSNPNFHTDFVVICFDMFLQRPDHLDMFDIIHTLSTLIKSTVYRSAPGSRAKIRETKIIVSVDNTADPVLIKQIIQFPHITSVVWTPSVLEDLPGAVEQVNRLIDNDYTLDSRILELLKPKKKPVEKKKDVITLTVRQAQILQLIQDRGASNKTIARMLGLSESTVKLHMGAILKKYGVKNRTQLAVFSKDHH